MGNSDKLAQDRTDWAEDRTVLANERTFAGWMRTGMGAIAVAVGLKAVFGEFEPTWLAKMGATLFLVIALLIFWSAQQKARETDQRLSEHDTESHPKQHFLLLAALFSVGTVFVGYILWML